MSASRTSGCIHFEGVWCKQCVEKLLAQRKAMSDELAAIRATDDRVPAYLLSLPELADALRLPMQWLKAEADAGRLPHIRIGRRYRFNRAAVVAALAKRAAAGGGRQSAKRNVKP